MVLLDTGKFQNFKASVEKYTQDNLVTTEGLRVNLEGLPSESTPDEWIDETILGIGEIESVRGVGGSVYANVNQPMVNFNIFVKKQHTTKTNRHYELRDIVVNYFKLGDTINLYDFSTGDFTNVIQIMKVREIVTDQAIPSTDFHQWTYAIAIEWRQEWS